MTRITKKSKFIIIVSYEDLDNYKKDLEALNSPFSLKYIEIKP